jgi:membrane-associated phospholipid phosphatase
MFVHAHTAGAIPPRHSPACARRSGAAGALGVAGLCLLGLALVWATVALLPSARVRDSAMLHDFTLLNGTGVGAIATFVLDLLEPLPLTIWGLGLVLVAIARERPRVALAVALVMGLAPLSSDALKPLLAHPHVHVGGVHVAPASWPSGHATVALALVLCALLVAPARRRPAVALLGGAFSIAVGCALLIRAWHMPSDVIGGYMVAALWTALAVAALRGADRRWPSDGSRAGASSAARR